MYKSSQNVLLIGIAFAAFEEYPLGGIAPGSSMTRRSLAGHLRSELEVDAVVRGLQDRLAVAESGMGDRERELKTQVEKLTQTNRELLVEIKAHDKSIRREDSAGLKVLQFVIFIFFSYSNCSMRIESYGRKSCY